MKRFGRPRFALVSLSILALALLVGGCPVTDSAILTGEQPTDAAASRPDQAPSPGTYWVEQNAAGLVYFEPPAQRNTPGRWTALLEEEALWFSGPAFYTRDPVDQWSRAHELDGLTLDDLMQVYDAPPAVP
jgi:hypothetical protein